MVEFKVTKKGGKFLLNPIRLPTTTVDSGSYDLAVRFLGTEAPSSDYWALARDIQDAVEYFFKDKEQEGKEGR